METTGVYWTRASTRWWCGRRVTSRPCVGAMLEWSHVPPSVTSPWPKHPFRGWRRSGPKEGKSPRTFSYVFVLWGSASYAPAPRPSTAVGRASESSRSSCCRRGALGPPELGEHESRRDEGLKRPQRWAGWLKFTSNQNWPLGTVICSCKWLLIGYN